jgi:hypothetical protein
MNTQLEYRIYYQDEEITTVTTQTAEGDYIVVDEAKWMDVQKSPSAFKVIDKELIKKVLEITNGKKKKKLGVQNKFPGWVVEKYNMYEPIAYADKEPDWYDNKKYNIVGKL